jgi:hypothetical protein
MWLAPNVMTFLGWVLTVAICLILSYYDPYIVATGSYNNLHKQYHIPQWIWIYIALAHFAAHTLDGCDGKQARRTNSRWIYKKLDYYGRLTMIKQCPPICRIESAHEGTVSVGMHVTRLIFKTSNFTV